MFFRWKNLLYKKDIQDTLERNEIFSEPHVLTTSMDFKEIVILSC